MKYLKRYNESNFYSIVKDIKDMCIDLNDDYINTEVVYDDESSTLQVHFTGFRSSSILWSSISEYVDRIIGYLKLEDLNLVDMYLGLDEVINPEETIEYMNKNTKYTSDLVSFIFAEKEKSDDLIKTKQDLVKKFTDSATARKSRMKKK